MIRALLLFFFILLALFTSVLTRLNLEPVNFNYYFGTVELSQALLLALAIMLGALLSLMLTLGVIVTSKTNTRRLRRNLQLREQEIRNLRDIPIKGRH